MNLNQPAQQSEQEEVKGSPPTANEKAQEEALRALTVDYTLSINSRQVRTALKQDELLKDIEKDQLVCLRRNAKKRLHRQRPGKVTAKTEVEKLDKESLMISDLSFSQQEDPDYNPEQENEAIGPQSCSQKRKSNEHFESRKEKAWKMIKHASIEGKGYPLTDAVIQRIVQPEQDLEKEFMDLQAKLGDHEATKLFEELCIGDRQDIDKAVQEHHEPDVVIKAFIQLAEFRKDDIWNQFLLEKKLLPAVLNCQELPEIPIDKVRYAVDVLYSLTCLLRDRGNWKLLPKVFAFSHSIGRLNTVVPIFSKHQDGIDSFKRYLHSLSFCKKVANIIGLNYQILSYSSFIEFLAQQEEELQLMICNLISKVVAVANPTEPAKSLAEFLKRRKFLGYEILNRKGDIGLTLDELLGLVKDLIKIEDRADVIKILELDSHRWIDQVKFQLKMLSETTPELLQEKGLFDQEVVKEGLVGEFKEMQEIASELHEQIDKFQINHFQSYAATKIVAANRKTTVASIPSGSGKTYIAALLAKHYQKQGQKVAIVTTEDFLVTQMNRMLSLFRYEVDILTMEQALRRYEQYDVLILDEADDCVLEFGSTIDPDKMRIIGFWDLMERKTILLTATVGKDLEEVLCSFFGETKHSLIKFDNLIKQSDKTSCIQQIDYTVFKHDKNDKDDLQYWQAMECVIRGECDTNPIIVYVDTKKKARRIEQICKANRVTYWEALDDRNLEQSMAMVASQTKGLLCALPKYGRGSDIRFKSDSFILIGYLPQRLETIQQMTGRSSRKMKSHHSQIICTHKTLDSNGVRQVLEGENFLYLKDGIKIGLALRGRRLAGETNDKELAQCFKNGWRIDKKALHKIMSKHQLEKFERLGRRPHVIEVKQPVMNQ